MNIKELDYIKKADWKKMISADELSPHPRTLIYGYTCDRDTFHVYLDVHDLIHIVVYKGKTLLYSSFGESVEARLCVPDKRLYPEACDFEMCTLLKTKDVELPFTIFNPDRPRSDFYGLKLDELNVI
jgi:hypothetical protein